MEGEWIDLANETIMQRSLILRYGCQDKAVKDFKVLYEHFYNGEFVKTTRPSVHPSARPTYPISQSLNLTTSPTSTVHRKHRAHEMRTDWRGASYFGYGRSMHVTRLTITT